jgi:hypothetical protein
MTKQEFLAMSLPYGLKIKDSFSTPNLTGIMDNEYHFGSYLSIDGVEEIKPILHPLSDLTKPIEHKGEKFVPMYELLKTQGFSVGHISNWGLRFHPENKSAVITNSNWMLRYMGEVDSFFLNGLKDWNKKHQKSRRQLTMFQQLIKWHFWPNMPENEEVIYVTDEFNPYK